MNKICVLTSTCSSPLSWLRPDCQARPERPWYFSCPWFIAEPDRLESHSCFYPFIVSIHSSSELSLAVSSDSGTWGSRGFPWGRRSSRPRGSPAASASRPAFSLCLVASASLRPISRSICSRHPLELSVLKIYLFHRCIISILLNFFDLRLGLVSDHFQTSL